MAYREVPVFEVREALRLWMDGRGYRAIAGLVPPDRKTVTRIVEVAVGLGLVRDGDRAQLSDEFVGLVIAVMRPPRPDRHGESWAVIEQHHDKIKVWVDAGDVPEIKMCELLARQGSAVPERTLNRYIADKFPRPVRSTVRVLDGEPGGELQVDFGELGMMFDEESGRRRRVWALVFTAAYSRHTFVWLSFTQNLDTVIAGFEEAWAFFGGVFKVVIPDNMKTVVITADNCDPGFNESFVEYAQSRGFVIDPARVRSPQDKPRVERTVAFVQGSFWAGENFGCLAEAQVAAELWCRVRAGLRDHNTTHCQPVVVFDAEEAPLLLPAPTQHYDLPVYQAAKVHPDRHIQVLKAIYSIPGELIGQWVDVRADTKQVKAYHRGQLIKIHDRLPAGGRRTDPADMPSEKTEYAMRDIESLKAQAHRRGAAIGEFVETLLDNPMPWTRMRRVYALFRACKTFGDDRVNRACQRAVEAECVDYKVVIRMVERALEEEAAGNEPVVSNVIVGRFARDPGHFAADPTATVKP